MMLNADSNNLYKYSNIIFATRVEQGIFIICDDIHLKTDSQMISGASM